MIPERTLTCIAGLPGTGKTHLARRLASQTGAVILSRDEIRAEIYRLPDYSDSEKASAFERMLARAHELLSQGRSVILEGMPFSRRLERDAARELARETGASFKLLVCTCPDEVAIKRIVGDPGKHAAADRDESLFHEVKSRFEPFSPDEDAEEISTCPASSS